MRLRAFVLTSASYAPQGAGKHYQFVRPPSGLGYARPLAFVPGYGQWSRHVRIQPFARICSLFVVASVVMFILCACDGSSVPTASPPPPPAAKTAVRLGV